MEEAEKQVEELEEKVENLYSSDNSTIEEIAEALIELFEAFKTEKMFWKQKSKVIWMHEGDRNSKQIYA